MDAAPSVLSDPMSLSRQQFRSAIEARRKWVQEANREYGDRKDATPSSTLADMARVNSEMDQLLAVGEVLFPTNFNPATLPGSGKGVGGWTPPPSNLKAGHWSKPMIDGREGKALTSGSIVVPALLPGIVQIPDRPILLSQVIPYTILTDTNLYAYLQETVRTHAAAEVAAGAQKPVSTYTVQMVQDTIRTIATISQPVNRFDLEDASLLDQYIQSSLSQAVLLRLDSELLNGNGTAPNLKGMLNVSGIQTQTFATDILQTARKALSKMYAIEIYGGLAYVMSPAQWEAVELAQLTTGAYIMQPGSAGPGGAPVDLAARRLWGQPVILTSALSGNNAVLFAPAYTNLWERDTVQIDWSEAPVGSVTGVAGFGTNEITFRAEGRWGFGVTKPAAVIEWATS